MKSMKEIMDEKKFSELFFVDKIERIKDYLLKFKKSERDDLRRDAQAVMCRGIPEEEVNQVNRGLQAENAFFYISRAYVPCAFLYGYKMGYFEENMTSSELVRVFKIGLKMCVIALIGHAILRYYAIPIIDKHRSYSEYDLQRKAKNDFIIQRNYIKESQQSKYEAPEIFSKK